MTTIGIFGIARAGKTSLFNLNYFILTVLEKKRRANVRTELMLPGGNPQGITLTADYLSFVYKGKTYKIFATGGQMDIISINELRERARNESQVYIYVIDLTKKLDEQIEYFFTNNLHLHAKKYSKKVFIAFNKFDRFIAMKKLSAEKGEEIIMNEIFPQINEALKKEDIKIQGSEITVGVLNRRFQKYNENVFRLFVKAYDAT